jgi:hypothetical protein
MKCLAAIVAACLMLAACRQREAPPASTEPQPKEKRGCITGRALLADAAPGGHLGILVYLAGTSYNAHTDENGAYTIADLPAGTYTIVAERQGYQTVTVDRVTLDPEVHTHDAPYIARTAILEKADSVLTTTGTATARPTRRLGSLYGYVTLVDAPSNDGVLVRIQGTPLVTVTDEAGIYRFLNVEQGAYRLTFEKPGFVPGAIDVVVVGGEDTRADSVLLEREVAAQERAGSAPISRADLAGDRMILGRLSVVDSSGNEVKDYSRVTVALDNSDYVVTPDEGGRFEFTRLPAGIYTVLASLDGSTPRSYLADVRQNKVAELTIELAPAPAQKPAPGIVKGKIELEADASGQPPDASGVQVALAGTRLIVAPAPDGTFKIEDVPPGTYVLTASRDGYEPARLDAVDVQAGQTVDVGTVRLELKRDYPRVVWTDPADGTRNLMVTAELVVKIKFSKPMDSGSVEKAVTIEPAPNYKFYMGTGAHPAADDRTAVIVFSNEDDAHPIRFNTLYRITIARTASDQTGLGMKQDYSFSFVTGAPCIIRTIPRDGATAAQVNNLNMPISIFFNTRIRPDTFNRNSVRFRPRLDADPTFTFDVDPRTGWTIARIFPMVESGKDYTLTIDRGVRTSTDQPLSNTPFTLRFRTEKITRELLLPPEIR